MEPAVHQGGRLLSREPAGPVFELPAQHGDVDAKIVAALERISQGFRVLLREEARKRALSPIQAQFLVHLLHHGTELRRVSRLAGEFGLTQATVSDAVSALEAKGLVRREHWPEDRRVMTLLLTARGRRLAIELSAWANTIREHIEAPSPQEKEVVMRFLMCLITSLQREGVITAARMCLTCRFFQRDEHPEGEQPHHCALLDVPLSEAELRIDCPEHEFAAS